MRGREKLKKISFVVKILCFIYRIFPLKMRVRKFKRSIYLKGNFGILIRYALIKTIAKKCGDNVAIFQGVYILHPENLVIGSNVSIHEMSYIDSMNATISIGNDVSIAHGVTILSSSHNYADKNTNIKDQGLTFSDTTIQDNVWIGAKATILSGITVESGSIIGAGAVVTKDVLKDTVVAGVPAKIIKKR